MSNEKLFNIDGHDYYIRKFKGRESFIILDKLKSLYFKLVSSFDVPVPVNEAVLPAREPNELEAFSKIDELLTTEEKLMLLERLVSQVYKGTSVVKFDDEFSGNMMLLMKVAKEVVMYNYEDVFQTLGIGKAT